MSEIMDHYQKEIDRLNKELNEARRQAANYRDDRNGKLKSAEQQTLDLQAELDKLRKENKSLSTKLENFPAEKDQEIDRLKGELRTRDHRSKFDKLAGELKVRPEALDDAFNFSWKAESDEVDEEAMKAAIGDLLERKPYLRAEDPQPQRPIHMPGPGGGRGPKPTDTPGHFTATAEQMRDFQFVRANKDKILAAQKNGTFKRLPSTLEQSMAKFEG